MGVLGDVIAWFGDAGNWTGDEGIPVRVYEHVVMSVQSTALGALIALPVGLYIGHKRRFEFVAVTLGNLGRALPSFGVLGLTYAVTLNWPGNIGFWPTFIALVLLSIPPILANTYVGIKGVDADTVEAARGMGMRDRDILTRLELPVGSPIIIAGVRTAAVQVVATATLGAYAGWGGLGVFIRHGLSISREPEIAGGAILVALLAIATEVGLGLFERVVKPRTTSVKRKKPGVIGPPSGPPDVRAGTLAGA